MSNFPFPSTEEELYTIIHKLQAELSDVNKALAFAHSQAEIGVEMARVDQEELATAREKLKQISSILDDWFIEITELGCAENEHNDGQLINLVEMLHAIGIICEIERERRDN